MPGNSHTFLQLAVAIVALGIAAPASAVGYQDYRSPDTVDPRLHTPPPRQAEPATISDPDGFDWGDAGIGASAALGLALIGFSAAWSRARAANGCTFESDSSDGIPASRPPGGP